MRPCWRCGYIYEGSNCPKCGADREIVDYKNYTMDVTRKGFTVKKIGEEIND